jgi:hypothetical protein
MTADASGTNESKSQPAKVPPGVHIHDLEDSVSFGGSFDTVVTMVTTASLLPFLHALATQAGNRAYEAARERVRNLAHRNIGPSVARLPQITIHDEDSNLRFVVPAGLPDRALQALAVADLHGLAYPNGERAAVIYWDADAGEWRSGTA